MEKYRCAACGAVLAHDSADSPMLENERWYDVLDHYGLWRVAARAREKNIDAQIRRGNEEEVDFHNSELHTFVCVSCMEKALGRKLSLQDVVNGPFNKAFIKKYIGDKK